MKLRYKQTHDVQYSNSKELTQTHGNVFVYVYVRLFEEKWLRKATKTSNVAQCVHPHLAACYPTSMWHVEYVMV